MRRPLRGPGKKLYRRVDSGASANAETQPTMTATGYDGVS